VQSKEANITNLKTELKGKPTEEREAQLRTFITAAMNGRAELINQYNADARKEGTIGQFKASDLPYQLDLQGETTCVL
jgi:hypothetical protein